MLAIAAVFIALALGILIGVSFGDNFLLSNQRDVLQLMEVQLEQLRESNRRQEIELQRWAALEPQIWRNFEGALAGRNIIIISPPGQEDDELGSLLRDAGAAATVIRIPKTPENPEKGARSPEEAEALACLLARTEKLDPEELTGRGLSLAEEESSPLEGPPDCCLLLVEAADFVSDEFFQQLRLKLSENEIRVIVLFPWRGEGPPRFRAEKGAAPPGLVDNINTFWGQVALLKMIDLDISGHYGFGKDSAGLIPAQTGGG